MSLQKRRRTWSYKNYPREGEEEVSSKQPQALAETVANTFNTYQHSTHVHNKCKNNSNINKTSINCNNSNSNSNNKKKKDENIQMVSLSFLDNSQRAAVTFSPNKPLLIQAGAGSGKTQTMATRVAFLIHHCHISPRCILGICFTRQAAETLRERVRRILLQEINRASSSTNRSNKSQWESNNNENNYYKDVNHNNIHKNTLQDVKLKDLEYQSEQEQITNNKHTAYSNNKHNNKGYCAREHHLNNLLSEMKLRTMHAFALETLRRYNCIDASTNVFDANMQRRLAWRVVEHFATQEKSSEAVDDLIGYVNKVKTRIHQVEDANEPHYNKQAAYLFQFYERLLHEEEHAVDFGDLLQMFLQILVKYESKTVTLKPGKNISSCTHKNNLEHTSLVSGQEHQSATAQTNELPVKHVTLKPSEVCLTLRKRYTHIVVDEFQDFNEIQLEILALLAGNEHDGHEFSKSKEVRCNEEKQELELEEEEEEEEELLNEREVKRKRGCCQVTCVGDPNQCIYAWRGALPQIFKLWSERFDETTILTLSTNYRSTREIVDVSNKLVHSTQIPFNRTNSNNNSNSNKDLAQQVMMITNCPVTLFVCDTIADEAEGLIYLLKEHLPQHVILNKINACNTCDNKNEGNVEQREKNDKYTSTFTNYNDVAILCRTRKRVQQMLDILESHHIPSCHLQRTLSDNCSILQALLSYLRVCVDLQHCNNEDVRNVLSHSPNCLTTRGRKELFFSLDAVLREKMSKSNKVNHNASSSFNHVTESSYYDTYNLKEYQDKEGKDENKYVEEEEEEEEERNKRFSSCTTYYTLLKELVFYNFAVERFPKLQVSKKSQKVIRSFIQLTTEAAAMLSESSCNMEAVLQLIIQEGGFERAMHEKTILSKSKNAHPTCNTSTATNTNTNNNNNTSNNSNNGKERRRYKSSLAASLAQAVAEEFSTSTYEPTHTNTFVNNRLCSANNTCSDNSSSSSSNTIVTNGNKTQSECKVHNESEATSDETDELFADAHLSLSELLTQAYHEVLQTVEREKEEEEEWWEEEEEQQEEQQLEEREEEDCHVTLSEINNRKSVSKQNECERELFTRYRESSERERVPYNNNNNNNNKKKNVNNLSKTINGRIVAESIGNVSRTFCSPAMILRRVIDQFVSLLPSDDFGSLCFTSESVADNTFNKSSSSNNNETQVLVAGKVTVGTVHQAKGMEWPIVVVPGCWVGEFPIRSNNEEERRIFYVAITRAMRELYLITANKYADALDGLSDYTCGAPVQQTPYLNCISNQLRTIRLSEVVHTTKEIEEVTSEEHELK